MSAFAILLSCIWHIYFGRQMTKKYQSRSRVGISDSMYIYDNHQNILFTIVLCTMSFAVDLVLIADLASYAHESSCLLNVYKLYNLFTKELFLFFVIMHHKMTPQITVLVISLCCVVAIVLGIPLIRDEKDEKDWKILFASYCAWFCLLACMLMTMGCFCIVFC